MGVGKNGSRFGNDAVDGKVMFASRHLVDQLQAEGSGYPRYLRPQERQQAIVEATTITEAPPLSVEGNARYQNPLGLFGGCLRAMFRSRLRNVPLPWGDVLGKIGDAAKFQHAGWAVNTGQQHPLACLQRMLHQRACVGFAAKGQSEQDTMRLSEIRKLCQCRANHAARRRPLDGWQRVALGENARAQCPLFQAQGGRGAEATELRHFVILAQRARKPKN